MKKIILWMVLLSFMNAAAKDLTGKWFAQEAGTSLVFVSKNILIYDGGRLQYKIIGDKIRIPDPYLGYVDYPYKMQNGKLYIRFPEGYTLSFVKAARKKQNTRQKQDGKTQNYLLRGSLCHYSSSYNGGYSHSDRLYFDGIGRYSTGYQTYSSGSSGAYAGEGADGNGGSYSVMNGRIFIQTDDGSSYEGRVIEQQNDGRITGINVNGKVFGSALCD